MSSVFFILVFGRPVVAVLGASGRTGAMVVEAGCGRTNQVLLKSPHLLGAAWCNKVLTADFRIGNCLFLQS